MSGYVYLADTTPRAAKEHRCQLCGHLIPVGQRHVARRYVFEGRAETARMHLGCELITKCWTSQEWEDFDYSQRWPDQETFIICNTRARTTEPA
jgi:hypothetical protein